MHDVSMQCVFHLIFVGIRTQGEGGGGEVLQVWQKLFVDGPNIIILFKIKNPTYSFAPKSLIFKLQPEVWKFYDICMSWSTLKTDVETNFLNLENWRFGYLHHFFSIVTFK